MVKQMTQPAIKLDNAVVYHGNCLEVLRELPENSVDSIVTDPPYELGFMGKKWDDSGIAFNTEVWEQAMRVLKPGGHILAFGGSRTWHRLCVAIEDAGFEIRDSIAWLYGSGFPKSMNIGKAIDATLVHGNSHSSSIRKANESRPGEGEYKSSLPVNGIMADVHAEPRVTNDNPETPEAEQWQGWGTALKPAFEPVVVGRKPLAEKTVAKNVLAYGTGGLNIDGSRIGTEVIETGRGGRSDVQSNAFGTGLKATEKSYSQGRWPANVIFSHTVECVQLTEGSSVATPAEEVSGGIWKDSTGKPAGPTYDDTPAIWQCPEYCPVWELDQQSGTSKSRQALMGTMTTEGSHEGYKRASHEGFTSVRGFNDTGGASRFFYTSKASKRDRNEGLDGMPLRKSDTRSEVAAGIWSKMEAAKQNFHPTVKPTDLMRYLIKLVTPPGGTVLDPFTGSGSTGKAALLEGFNFVGIELTEDYLPIIQGRLQWAADQAAYRLIK